MRGTLFLVVGPSGAGKDSLIGVARGALADDSRIVFARRAITRPDSPDGGEAHEPLSPAAFASRAAAGGFMLHWRAYGTDYGIPASYAAALAAGSAVVANVSRTIIAAAAKRFAPVCVVEVTAPPCLLEARLAGRAREGAGGVAMRLSRSAAIPDGVPRSRVENAGTLEEGAARLIGILRG